MSDTSALRTSGPELKSLQVMRGIAAIAVVAYHTHLILSKPEYGALDRFGAVAGKGWIGVNFFFVLSGFIICFAHARDIGAPSALPRYAWRRFSRVYPIYWIVLTGYIAAALAGLGSADFGRTLPHLASAYLLVALVPAPQIPLQVAWTLFYEVQFYAAFALLIANRSVGMAIIGLWVGTILVAAWMRGYGDEVWLLHVWNLYFLVGAAVFAGYRRVVPSYGLSLLIVGVVLLGLALFGGMVDNHIAEAQRHPWQLLALSVPFALILLGGALSERRFGWRPGAVPILVGDASYAIYLVHSPVISLLATLYRHFGHGALPVELVYAIVFVTAASAGIALHLLIERRLLDILRRAAPFRRMVSPA